MSYPTGPPNAGTVMPERKTMFSQVTKQYRLDPLPPRPWGSNVIQLQPIQYYRPHDKQVLALRAPSGEIFFGGAKGGGKSLCLLLAFAAQERLYGRHARGIIFRRTQPEFADLRTKASELFRGLAEWKGKEMTWVFRSGATLRMAHLDTVQDVGKYTGQEYTFIGFDELTEWASRATPTSFMKTCLRNVHGVPGLIMSSAATRAGPATGGSSTDSSIRCRRCAGSRASRCRGSSSRRGWTTTPT